MTLAHVEDLEADAVTESAAGHDAGLELAAGLALAAADRDGLLENHGYVRDNHYEFVVLGRRWVLSAEQAGALVHALRALKDLGRADPRVTLTGITEDGAYQVRVGDGQALVATAEDVPFWCAGYRAAMDAARAAAEAGLPSVEHVGEDHIAQIAELFDQPSLDDQSRFRILGLMYGRGRENKVTADKLADMVGRAEKTVVTALTFGAFFSSALRDDMVKVFGFRWSLTGGGLENADGSPLSGPLPEMPQLAGLRRILAASRRGWLRYVDNPHPSKARWRTRFKLAVGQKVHVVLVPELLAWLDGLEAFYTEGTVATKPS